MKSFYSSALALFFMMVSFSSCRKDNDVVSYIYTPETVSYQTTKLFEVPYVQFGASKEFVKAVLKNKAVKEESDEKIVYEGESEDEFQVYYFELGKLVESATFIKAKYQDYVYSSAMKKKYSFLSDTRGPVSPMYLYANSVYSYVTLTKQSNTVWMIDYIAHDRLYYQEIYDEGEGFIFRVWIIKAKEYLP